MSVLQRREGVETRTLVVQLKEATLIGSRVRPVRKWQQRILPTYHFVDPRNLESNISKFNVPFPLNLWVS